MTHRVVCFGGRFYSDKVAVYRALDDLRVALGDFMLIHGAARGADALSGDWGIERGLMVCAVAAPWSTHGKAAGHKRNAWMAERLAPTYGVQFPGGTGTADMRRRLGAIGVIVWEPYP